MHKTKKFNNLDDLASWLNKNPDKSVLSIITQARGIEVLYKIDVPAPVETYDKVLTRKLKPVREGSRSILFSDFLNSVRNVKPFTGEPLIKTREIVLKWLHTQPDVRLVNSPLLLKIK